MHNNLYSIWCDRATNDPDLIKELKSMESDENAIKEAFYKNLEFGTGGLRGIIGAGTNRMNIYTVGKATQGLSEYINSVTSDGKVAIAYDSRIKSELFAKTAAEIFAANGIHVYIYSELMPTPMLSFAVRHFGCDAGIVITASHNPSKYNGYKAYGPDGCQLNLDASEYVLNIMNQIDVFDGVKRINFDDAVENGNIEFIGQDAIEAYLDNVKNCGVLSNSDCLKDLSVIYTPLHGSGNKPVRAILDRIGVNNVIVVKEQEMPDGNFPTAPYPNPEIKQPFEIALRMSQDIKPDILLATDPDCDRVGIAVRHDNDYKLLTGNDVGALLVDFILSQKKQNGTLPHKPIAVKTIVTTELCQKICDNYGCELINVLTGFKFIGEQIGILENKDEADRYLFGFEESYGYLAGSYVRDKDAVVASMLICEMAAYYKSQGITLVDKLNSLFDTYGYYICAQSSFAFEGISGMEKMSKIMVNLRENSPSSMCGSKTVLTEDYLTSEKKNLIDNSSSKITLPKSNVISFTFDNGCKIIIRPSGTEPKIKVYFFALSNSEETSKSLIEQMKSECALWFK